VYPLPKNTNKWKLLFISILCIISIICVHIVRYLHKLMLCWKFHIIPTRNSQDMDHWTIYLQFWGHVHLGDSACKCAWAKIKNWNIWNVCFDIELFHSLKSQAFEKIFYLFLLQFIYKLGQHFFIVCFTGFLKTRGPRGPWVAHLRKRSKVTVEPFTEDH